MVSTSTARTLTRNGRVLRSRLRPCGCALTVAKAKTFCCATLALLNQIAHSAACNRIHSVDERCARWLLMSHDRVKSDTFALTQESLAQCVHRPTVSVAAGMLQK